MRKGTNFSLVFQHNFYAGPANKRESLVELLDLSVPGVDEANSDQTDTYVDGVHGPSLEGVEDLVHHQGVHHGGGQER